jgi:hypothetical protein
MSERETPEAREEFWFPGRWLGGTSMLLGPLLLLSGVLLRIQEHFFFPDQLKAAVERPDLMTAAYGLVAIGNIVLWPAILTLTHLVGRTRPRWALWGGSLVVFGLFARTFHAGCDHLAFQIARVEGVSAAVEVTARTYAAFNVVSSLNATIMSGWIVLAIGGYVSQTLPLFRAVALGAMSALMLGILKGSSWLSVACAACLCVALIPSGVQVLTVPPRPTAKAFLQWAFLLAGLVALLFISGRLG